MQLCSASGPALRLASGAFLVLIALMGSVFCATRTCRSESADALLLDSAKKKTRGHRFSPRPSSARACGEMLRDHFVGGGEERSGMVRPSALRS